jgi:ABC-type sugar transport system ATPase subunit
MMDQADPIAPALFFDNISCTFISKDDRSQRYTAVADTILSVAPGEFVSVVGPTGCGKSTLLNVGAGLLAPSSGKVSVFGEPLSGINRRAGYMFQAEALMPWYSALQNVTAGLHFRGVPEAAPAVGRHAQARGPCADADPRSRHHPDGRTILGARYPDQAADGKRTAGIVEREEKGGAVHHP